MRKVSRKSIIEASLRMRNEEAIKKQVERDEKIMFAESYYGSPKEYKSEKQRSPFKIGSLCLSILP